MKHALAACLFLTAAPVVVPRLATAQVTAQARVEPAQIRVGETAELSVQVRGAQNAAAPELGQPTGLSIRYLGPSTEVSIVNGRMSTSITHRYAVTGLAAGSYTVGPILVPHEGRQIAAGSASLVVQAAGAPVKPGAPAQAGGGALRLHITTPRRAVFLHERVPLTVELWVGSVRVGDLQYPAVPGEGVAMEKLPEPTQRREETAEGAFEVVQFATTLTPLRAGAVTVGPARMGLRMLDRRRGRSPFEGFFGGDPFGLASQPVEIASDPLVLEVLPLPEENRPVGFSGAVGRFDLQVDAAPRGVAAGDPVTVTITLGGTGNLEAAAPPAIPGSEALRAYPPQARVPKPDETPLPAGTKVFEQVVIPQRAGPLVLPALSFAFFDPEARAYRSVTRGPIAIAVREAAPGNAGPAIVGARPEAKPAAPLGADIVTIKDDAGVFRPRGVRRWRRPGFWVWQPVPLLLWVGAVAWDRRRRRLAGDLRLVRFAGAGAEARRALAEARRALAAGDRAAGLDRTARAVADYLAAKLDLPPGTVTVRAAERLQGAGVDAAVVRDVEEVFATLERARFAPGEVGAVEGTRALDRADAIVRALERMRRLARALGVVLLVAGGALAGAAAPDGAATRFFRGNTLYGEGRFAEAAAEYEAVLAGGRESGNLHFNLGNAWFRAGDVGRALLAYERARGLVPRDPDLRANVAFAREKAGTADADRVLVTLLLPLAARMTGDELAGLASLCWTAALLGLAASRAVPRLAPAMRPVALAAGLGLALVLPSAVWRIATIDAPARAVVVAGGETTVRFEPSAAGTAHFAVRPGTVVRVLGQREGWLQVAGPDGRRGWLAAAAVATL